MRFDSRLHEPRTNAEQSETGDDIRGSFESVLPEPYAGRLKFAVARGYALSPRSICDMFGVSRATVHNALAMGLLPGFRLGNLWRIRPENMPLDLVAYWVRRKHGVPQPLKALPTGELVYFIAGAPGFVKIGYTQNLAKRIRALQCGCPAEIELLAFVRGSPQLEREYHRRFAAWRGAGEWFRTGPPLKAEIARLNAPLRPSPPLTTEEGN